MPMKTRPLVLLQIVGAAMLLSACGSLKLQPLTSAEIIATTQADQAALSRDVEALQHELSLEEAIARAIKYNAERRLRMMEEAVASGTYEVSNFDMLPLAMASAGYRDRDRDVLTLSKDLSTNTIIGGQTISSSRQAATTSLGFSWSLLDFGQSYYAARGNADRVLVTAERRRKALHTLVQDVTTSFWRVASAQKLDDVLHRTIADAESAIREAQHTEKEGLRSPIAPLRYQLQLLENLRLLESIKQELSTARVELAALTHLPLTQDFRVSEPDVRISTAWLDVPVDKMEDQVLMHNASLREDMYHARIARTETRRVMLRMFPGLSFNYSHHTDDDPYLINNSWNETGAQISFNLLSLLAQPARMRLADAGVALADQKRMTTQMAVLAQLHIARQLYGNAAHQFQRADRVATIHARLTEHVMRQADASKLSQQDRVAEQTANIVALLRRYQALSNAHAAASRLQASLGLEPSLDDAGRLTLAELTRVVGDALQTWDSGRLPEAKAAGPVAAK